jgi:CHAD domain-containing protein
VSEPRAVRTIDLSSQLASELARLRKALDAVGRSETRNGEAGATGDQDAVHAARRSIKVLRATLRLLGDPADDPARKSLDDALRALSGSLSRTRDLHVAVTTSRELRKGLRSRKRGPDKALRTGLDSLAAEWTDKASAMERGRRLKGDEPALEALESMAQELATVLIVPDLVDQSAGTYRKARERLTSAFKTGDPVALHAARRLVVRCQLQGKVLQSVTGKGKGRLRQLNALRGLLGDHHDLTVMQALAGETPHAESVSEDLAELVVSRQRKLVDAARPLANELFSGSARKFREKLESRLERALQKRDRKRGPRG